LSGPAVDKPTVRLILGRIDEYLKNGQTSIEGSNNYQGELCRQFEAGTLAQEDYVRRTEQETQTLSRLVHQTRTVIDLQKRLREEFL